MILYHGSNMSIDAVDLKRSKRAKDFGQGFYLSKDIEQAQKMAELTTFRQSVGYPTITAFNIDDSFLLSCSFNIKIFEGYTEEWAEFVLMNRRNSTSEPAHSYDIVVGPIADDKVGVQIRRFIMGYISCHQLMDELSYINGPTIQYFFGTERAIQLLKRI
ncbi:MAG: DUF3990 domain-containing protein [Parabacteroides sp.]|nr:DUF3990 domain-containing protein [Parabacteroides sp.]